jgi:hypothetical protein
MDPNPDLPVETVPDKQVQAYGSGPRGHLITEPTGSGTQPEKRQKCKENIVFSIHLHGLDTVLHLLQVGQIGLQQKLHLLPVI